MAVDTRASGIGLHIAAREGETRVVLELLAKRDPAVDIEGRDILGDTALLKAARYGKLEVVEALLEAGANAGVQDKKKWGCLHVSVANNHEAIFRAILAASPRPLPADIEAATEDGDTPLHVAAYHGRLWAVTALLHLGARLDARNNQGQVPYDVARNHEDTRALLQQQQHDDCYKPQQWTTRRRKDDDDNCRPTTRRVNNEEGAYDEEESNERSSGGCFIFKKRAGGKSTVADKRSPRKRRNRTCGTASEAVTDTTGSKTTGSVLFELDDPATPTSFDDESYFFEECSSSESDFDNDT